jgi:hypothetical protein
MFSLFASPEEFVGPVAFQAKRVFFLLDTPFGAVHPGFELIQDIVMAGQALVNPEKIRSRLVHIPGIGVKGPLSDTLMTVLAGGLTVGGHVKSFCIDEPRTLSGPGAERQHQQGTQHEALFHHDPHPIQSPIPVFFPPPRPFFRRAWQYAPGPMFRNSNTGKAKQRWAAISLPTLDARMAVRNPCRPTSV